MDQTNYKGIDDRTIKCSRSFKGTIESGISFDQDTVNGQHILRFHFLSQDNDQIDQITKLMYLDQTNINQLIEALKNLEVSLSSEALENISHCTMN